MVTDFGKRLTVTSEGSPKSRERTNTLITEVAAPTTQPTSIGSRLRFIISIRANIGTASAAVAGASIIVIKSPPTRKLSSGIRSA